MRARIFFSSPTAISRRPWSLVQWDQCRCSCRPNICSPGRIVCDCFYSSSRSWEADVAMKFPASDWQQPTGISMLLCLSHGMKGSSCCRWGRSTSLLASSSPAVFLLQHTGVSSQLKGNSAGSSPRLYRKEERAGEEKAGDASSLVHNTPWESRCKERTEMPAIPLGAQHALGDISPWRLVLPSQYFEKYSSA